MKKLFTNIIAVWSVISLVNFRVSADDKSIDGIHHCCLPDFARFSLTNNVPYCLGGWKESIYEFDIHCHEQPVVVIEYESLEEIKKIQEEYCYVQAEEENNQTVYLVAICDTDTEYKTPLSVHLMPISFIFLVITFVIYYKIKTLRAPEDFAFIITVACLAIFMFIHVSHYWVASITPVFHAIFAFLDLYIAQFAIVAYFAWLNVIMANQLRKNMSSSPILGIKKWIYLNHIYGWGVPSLVLLITLANTLMDGARTEEEIVFNTDYEFTKFVPIGILWLINCVLLGMVLYYAIKYPSNSMNRKVIQYRSWKYFQLFLVSGFLWVFELLSWIFSYSVAAQRIFSITDCINALQGLYLFIVMVLLRLHVRRSLAGTRIFCFTLPQKWSTLEDSEDVELMENKNSVNVHHISGNTPSVL